jgi:hypothetical protein
MTTTTTQTPGRGTLVFNADEARSCYGRVRPPNGHMITLRGTYSELGATLAGEGVTVQVRKAAPPANPNPELTYPVGRASVLFSDTGEIIHTGMWAPKNENAIAFGLTDDENALRTPANPKPFG